MQNFLFEHIHIYITFIFFNIFMIFLFNTNILKKSQKNYYGVQKIHDGYIPRIAGLVFYIFLLILNLNNHFYFSEYFLALQIASFPLIIISLMEDLYLDIQPKIRSLFLILSGLLLITSLNDFPTIEFPVIGHLINDISLINMVFFVTSIYILCNSINLIDGVNGLAIFNCLSITFCLIIISFEFNDFYFLEIFQFLFFCFLIQLIFNFPFPKFFMGDLGSYFVGFVFGGLIINFFAKHNEYLNSWIAVMIIFYPIFETLFSSLRRLITNKELTSPDMSHLHHLIFLFIQNRYACRLSNSLTSVILAPLWSFPIFWISTFNVPMSLNLCFLGLFLQTILYFIFYFVFYSLSKENN